MELAVKDVIESHPINEHNYRITVDEIKDLFLEMPSSGRSLVSRVLIAGQMDADRMDYLLRDACHTGVNYGKYDLDRLVATVALCEEPDTGGYLIGIDEGGIHAVEGLLIARYMMFTQLYFHKTRVIYDYHFVEAMKDLLQEVGGHLPPPDTVENIQAYLEWDDWRVLGAIAEKRAGVHGAILQSRDHYRLVYSTSEVPSFEELETLEQVQDTLKDLHAVTREASKSWYKFEKEEIWIKFPSYTGSDKPIQLSRMSAVVKGLETVKQGRVYVPRGNREEAEQRLKACSGKDTRHG